MATDHPRNGFRALRHTWSLLLAFSCAALVAASCSEETAGPSTEPTPDEEEDKVVIAEVPPPPISGGTLIVARNGITAVAADPDRDIVWLVDVQGRQLLHEIALERGDEPGRVVEDGSGRAHVVLRRAGAVLTIDIASGAVVARRQVCAAPRGIAVDAEDVLHVSCLAGELVSLPAAGGDPIRRVELDDDLRDVIALGDGRLLVSRFRAAQVLVVAADGTIENRIDPTRLTSKDYFDPAVAYKMMLMPDGRVALLHQRGKASTVKTEDSGGYVAGACVGGSVVHGTISLLEIPDPGEEPARAPVGSYLPFTVVPVDFALSPSTENFIVASAGTDSVAHLGRDLFEVDNPCGLTANAWTPDGTSVATRGQPTAVAYDGAGRMIVQTREPARIFVLPGTFSSDIQTTPIDLPGESVLDTGHELFHRAPPSGFIACASCHAEGGDDGRTWDVSPMGLRRTQNLRGGITPTAPFHWDGSLVDMEALIQDTFVHRMSGPVPSAEERGALGHWLDSIPLLPVTAPPEADAVARGKALFESPATDCSRCHGGATLTDNRSYDVGKGGEFQTPSLLGLRYRAPFMHDGCAETLRDRFDPECGGASHGKISQLSETDVDDLVAYLESL